ncbi:TPA: CvfB family protein [Photobacterium damselae]|uniref:Conserved virulence factor B n=2 Tax=Photobacterium damselae TaxID=38293 RepID=A0A2T3QP21_PHODM|nr:S1-like domain-containing RNA-binding protein [Photobacterium damselae]AWK81799.1 GntR family transcriptional regulator [Photobacterium damselae]KAB1179247.1 GntR family transcriptional regulator [Photobacterium damselae subsp. damselae]KAB1179490.1 GntR family transcriptional regulator [Photobacterium damselae subsp. damselae]MBF7097982.1 GntR family transcriptional regulator [Photobacterium damselae]MCG3814786.1 GntR family transcriptional regulator [Photobacterium damselae]
MIKIGQYNTLEVVNLVDFGVFLDGGEDFGNILLPSQSVPAGTNVGDKIKVFLYNDSHDEVVATTDEPIAQVGEFAKMRVEGITTVGAFLDWGLRKNLLLPYSEQRRKLQEGEEILVRVYTDRATGRIVASTKFNRFLDKTPATYKVGDEVPVLIAEITDLGYKAIINNQHWGLLFKTECFGKLFIGKTLKAYVKEIREDGKINLSLQKMGKARMDDLSDKILTSLEKKGGFIPLSDKSTPEEIFNVFRTSKGTFKKTIGGLYKQGLIVIGKDGIRLNDND